MGSQVRWAQRWIVRAGLTGLFVVLCGLAGFSLLTQDRVAKSAVRANAASQLSAIYQDARYRVGLEQSLVRRFRLSPDVSVLVARGQAEAELVVDLQRIAALARTPTAKAVVARLAAADGAYDEVGYDTIQAVYAHNYRLVQHLDQTRGEAAFALVQGIVSGEAATAQRNATAPGAALATYSASAKQAMVIAFTLGLGLIVFFGVVVARISSRLNRARAAEFETMAHMASTDPLTGLRNHRAFHDDLARELQRAGRGPTPLSLVMLDLDDLKTLNDGLGHQAGDERLQALAAALRASPSAPETALSASGATSSPWCSRARDPGARLNSSSDWPWSWSPRLVGPSVTAGISEALDTRDKDELIREADLALITAKRINQQVAIYSQDMHANVDVAVAEDEHHTRTLANALALAVDAKDSYTRSHCQTVAQLCVVIATELGMIANSSYDSGWLASSTTSARSAYPIRSCRSRDPLTDDEYEQMKAHSVLGAAIIEAADMSCRGSLGATPP